MKGYIVKSGDLYFNRDKFYKKLVQAQIYVRKGNAQMAAKGYYGPNGPCTVTEIEIVETEG